MSRESSAYIAHFRRHGEFDGYRRSYQFTIPTSGPRSDLHLTSFVQAWEIGTEHLSQSHGERELDTESRADALARMLTSIVAITQPELKEEWLIRTTTQKLRSRHGYVVVSVGWDAEREAALRDWGNTEVATRPPRRWESGSPFAEGHSANTGLFVMALEQGGVLKQGVKLDFSFFRQIMGLPAEAFSYFRNGPLVDDHPVLRYRPDPPTLEVRVGLCSDPVVLTSDHGVRMEPLKNGCVHPTSIGRVMDRKDLCRALSDAGRHSPTLCPEGA
jgi:hypothetical protein